MTSSKASRREYMRQWYARHPEYPVWQTILARCRSERRGDFKNYGGRGIKPCLGIDTFQGFLEAVGPRPSSEHTIDRIRNNDGYWCGRCSECILSGHALNMRWATRQEQARNKRNNRMITWNGKTQCFKDWVNELGVSYSTLHFRLRNWTLQEAMTCPVRPIKKKARKLPGDSTM